ncbi:MAG: exodeoxyribonuclease VII small subunit [Rhodobacteraceae bacterium]|nr:exodeoxyribonuclease VII small subunit [Paracoccaceae bacterium]MCY4249564.1 exodeoxyribonuclease VII small subunit [Paracoccaceae bacterium]
MQETQELLKLDRDEIYALNFEDALDKLEHVVSLLEKGSVSLDEAIELYVLGTKLRKHCDYTLREAQKKIDEISLKEPEAGTS